MRTRRRRRHRSALGGNTIFAGNRRIRYEAYYGRYRRVTDLQIARILAWHDHRIILRQLAREPGVCESTIGNVITSRGLHFWTESPEIRRLESRGRRRKERYGVKLVNSIAAIRPSSIGTRVMNWMSSRDATLKTSERAMLPACVPQTE